MVWLPAALGVYVTEQLDEAPVPDSVQLLAGVNAPEPVFVNITVPVGVVGELNVSATVTDTFSSPTTPTGTVMFTNTGSGAFTPANSCTLSGTGASSSCSVTYTPSAAGSQTITGTYSGDSVHPASS